MAGNLSSFKSMVYRDIVSRLDLGKQDMEIRLFVSGLNLSRFQLRIANAGKFGFRVWILCSFNYRLSLGL
jgi:hypothetical protein